MVDLSRTFSARGSNNVRTWAVGPGFYIPRPWRFDWSPGSLFCNQAFCATLFPSTLNYECMVLSQALTSGL
jgi:hypothetical protein